MRLAAVRNGQQDVVTLKDSEISVSGLGRVKEEGRGSRARQRRAIELPVEPVDERKDRGGFGAEHLARE